MAALGFEKADSVGRFSNGRYIVWDAYLATYWLMPKGTSSWLTLKSRASENQKQLLRLIKQFASLYKISLYVIQTSFYVEKRTFYDVKYTFYVAKYTFHVVKYSL